jgi:hypothetical protein
MSLGGITSAFADGLTWNDEKNALTGGTPTSPADAAITKILKLPAGTTIPSGGIKFSFDIQAVSVDGDTSETARNTMPVPEADVAAVTINESDKALKTTTSSGGIIAIAKESDSIYTTEADEGAFPHAGIYVYKVTEKANSAVFADDLLFTETVSYSLAEYQITLYVDAVDRTVDAYKNVPYDFYIANIATKITKKDSGDAPEGSDLDAKVNPTPGKNTEDIETDYSGLAFTNTFTKTKTPNTEDPEDPTNPANTSLFVSKQVTGSYANESEYFPFAITVTTPTIAGLPTSYNAYVVEGTGTVVTPTDETNGTPTGTDSSQRSYFTFASGTPKTVSLKHGQRLVFLKTPVGTAYTAVEAAAANYVPSVTVAYNGGTGNADNGGTATTINGALNAALSTQGRLVGEAANSAAFTNTRETVMPTGINLGNMPYYVLILLAAAALAAYAAARHRRRRSRG